jgi:hypothetical protein
MVSAMADWGFHPMLVWTSLALVMLSACSQEESAQEQRAAARADYRDEVAAAFERLKTSGRPYRKEMSSVISDQYQLTSHETAEFLPPD